MKYLLTGPDIVARIRKRHVVDIKSPINWLNCPEKATTDYEAAAKVTQRRLAELGMETHLEEIPGQRHPGPRWVICREY